MLNKEINIDPEIKNIPYALMHVLPETVDKFSE